MNSYFSLVHSQTTPWKKLKEEVLGQRLEGLCLIHCSLLPTQHLVFLDKDDKDSWAQEIAKKYPKDPLATVSPSESATSFTLCVGGSMIWLEITLAPVDDLGISKPSVSVKGEGITGVV